jgi:transcriptional regulator with XRE-family HTH domain
MQSTGRFTGNLRLANAVEAFNKGLCRESDVLVAYYGDKDVTKVIRSAARMAGQEDHYEDLKQSIALLLSTKYLGKISEPLAVYALIKQTCKNMLGDLLRKGKHAMRSLEDIADARSGYESDAISVDELHETIDEVSGDLSTNVATKLDQQKAAQMLLQILGTELGMKPHANAFLPANGERSHAVRRTRQRTLATLHKLPKELSSDSVYLSDLRSALGFTVEQLADNLGITTSVLCIYLYTNNKKVPSDVMAAARLLKQNTSSQRFKLITHLESVPIAELVESWMIRLGIDPGDRAANSLFGDCVEISRTTVWRWRQNKMDVPMITRLELENRVISLSEPKPSRKTAKR